MATELDDFAEEDAAFEAAMQAENLAHGMDAAQAPATEDEGDEPATAAAEASHAAPEPDTTAAHEAEPPAAAAPATDAPVEPAVSVAGVLAKDGKTVLPYGALKGARQEAKQHRLRADRAEQELADLKAGKKPEASDGEGLTPEEIEELTADFPQLGKLARVVAKVSQAAPAAPAPAAPADDPAEALQDAIDSVPLLAEWQAGDPEKWGRAVLLDKALQGSPKWRDKPEAARFAHIAGLVAAEYDIQTPAPAASPTAPTNRKPPDEVIKAAARNAPNTLSDFKGGAPDASRESIDRLPPMQQMRRMENMSDDEIESYLRKVG